MKLTVFDLYNTCSSKKEFISKIEEIFGENFDNKSGTYIDLIILKYLSKYGEFTKSDISSKSFSTRYLERQIKEYNKHPKYCKCGNVIPFEKRNNKYCSQSCGTKYSNLGKTHSVERNKKISKSVKEYFSVNDTSRSVSLKNKIKLSDLVKTFIVDNPNNYTIKDKYIPKYKIIKYTCSECGKKYYGYITKFGNLSTTYCSEECCKNHSKRMISIKAKDRIANGTFSGWKSRNIISYPEQFWINVLNNNNITFEREAYINNKYFLDFYIVVNNTKIDLEIDGKQHNLRKDYDKDRDMYLTKLGYTVYRIEWNEINSIKGKSLMKQKIDSFLSWYNNL